MKTDPFIAINQISYAFPDGNGRSVIADVSLTIEQGAFVVLVGPSGIGKSTLLRVLGGLLEPTEGTVQHAEQDDTPVGIVFQRDNLMPWRTAYDNAKLPLEILGHDDDSADKKVRAVLELVGLADDAEAYPSQLSGGMAQRIALARALVHQPSLLLLDEPFGALDALTRERMGQELLRIWQANPVTVFMVTHSITEAVFLADVVLVMGQQADQPATITHTIPIDIPRPRDFKMERTAVFLDYTTAVRQAIQGD
jgi:NitT/TauT family transport system ATP-binding protein